MKIEYDAAKRAKTLAERGLDFESVRNLDWDGAIYAQDSRADYGETRYIVFGYIGQDFVCVAYTIRNNRLRVISLRKANTRERRTYDAIKAND